MNVKVFVLIFISILWNIPENDCSSIKSGNVTFTYSLTTSGIKIEVANNGKTILTGVLNNGVDVSGVDCDGISSCNFGNYNLTVASSEDTFHILWKTKDLTINFEDCFDFGTAHWYGGPQARTQTWPVEKVRVNGNEAYILNIHYSTAERYWLNSNGAYIYLNDTVPLYVDQNMNVQDKVCFKAHIGGPYIQRTRNFLEYVIVVKDDPKVAHLHAVENYLGKPSGHPNTAMVKEPIWIPWAWAKSNISDDIILDFAKAIRAHGYTKGQLCINGYWESCYGAQEFDKIKFSRITETVAELHAMDFRVTLWTHPFVNTDCENFASEGIQKDYFVKNTQGQIDGYWWHGNNAYTVDFTKPAAVEWYTSRISKIRQDIGIDSFKFDAGESFYAPQPTVYENVDPETIPSVFTEKYLETCAKYGDLQEVRVAFRTQQLPIFMRMLDKNTDWGVTAGLYTLITTLLQLNLSGYTMILPDMIGGNGYIDTTPDAELMVRWTQANALMPSMQFSFLPWDYPDTQFDSEAIIKHFVDLHANFTPTIIEAMDNSIKYGTPVNAPIWWIDPTDEKALVCDDQFLLGEDILVAPVIKDKARSRDVYLPKGNWKDGNNGTIYEGPVLLKDYPAPIELLPYFSRIK